MLGTGCVISPAKPETRSGLSLSLGDCIRRRTALEGSELLPSIFASPASACPARSAPFSLPWASPLGGRSTNRTRCLACLDRPETLSIQPSLPSGIFAPRDQSARPAERSASLPYGDDRFPFSPRQHPACNGCPLTDHRSRICIVPRGSLIP